MRTSRPVIALGGLVLLAAVSVATEPADFPSLPTSFDTNRDDSNAQWAASFPQSACANKAIMPNVGHISGLDLTVDWQYANCVNDTNFPNVRNGIALTTEGPDFNAMMTSDDISTLHGQFTGTGARTIEIWFRLHPGGWPAPPAVVKEYVFLEISREASGTIDISETRDSLRFFYKRAQSGDPPEFIGMIENVDVEVGGTPITNQRIRHYLVEPPEFDDMVGGGIYYMVLTRAHNEASATLYMNGTADGPLTETHKGWEMNDRAESFDSNQDAFKIVKSRWTNNNRIRVGCSRSNAFVPDEGFPFSVLFAAIHNRHFSPQDFVDHFNAGLPNSLPVAATDGTLKLHATEDEYSALNLVDANVLKDVDGDTLQYIIVNVPTGPYGLYENDNLSTKLTAGHHLSDPSKLVFKADADHVFTTVAHCTADSGSSIVSGMQIAAIDGVCGSDGAGVTSESCRSEAVDVLICIDQVNDPPEIGTVADVDVTLGSDVAFTINSAVSDIDSCADGASGCGKLTDGAAEAQVRFANVSLAYGDLYDKCDSGTRVALVADDPYDYTTSFCFVSKAFGSLPTLTNDDPLGTDQFYFRIEDTGNLASKMFGTIDFRILNPLEACPSSLPDCTLTGVAEGSAGAAFTFQGTDFLSGSRGENFVYEIITPPKHGKLYYPTVSPTNELSAGSKIPSGQQALYVPDPDYFNVVEARNPIAGKTASATPVPAPDKYTSLDGTNGYFECDDLVNGCPDEFEFGLLIESSSNRSPPKPATIEVISATSLTGYELKIPEGIFFDASKNLRYEFTNGLDGRGIEVDATIAYTDPDGDAYFVGVDIFTDQGTMSVSDDDFLDDPNIEQYGPNKVSCINLNTQCQRIQFVGYPSAINKALSVLEFFSLDQVNAVNDRITIGIYKGLSSDAVAHGAGFFDFNGEPVVEKQIVLNPITSEDNEPERLSTQFIIIVSSMSVLAFILSINGLIWFGNKSKKAAAAARQSLRRLSRGSRSQSTTGDVELESVGGPSRSLFIFAFFFPCVRFMYPKKFEKTYVAKRNIKPKNKNKGASPASSTALAAAGPTPILSSTDSASASAPQNKRGSVAAQKTTVMEVADDSIFDWEKHIDKATGDVYFFNPKTGVSQWDPPTVQAKRAKK